eukprot:gene16350-19449_t
MAGPWNLNPGQSKGGIPTYFFGSTTVNVRNTGNSGRVRLQAGASPAEESNIGRDASFQRNFAAAYLTVTNLGRSTISVWTA